MEALKELRIIILVYRITYLEQISHTRTLQHI